MNNDPDDFAWDENVEVTAIDMVNKTIRMSNGYVFNHKKWYEIFVNFWDRRIVGKTIIPIFYEYLFAKGGSNAHEQLMKGVKQEGFLLGSIDKPILGKRSAIAIGTMVTIVIVVLIAIVVLKNQGMIPGM